MPSVQIAPSILAADFTRMGHEVRRVEEAGADSIHVDIMDGHFVPNLTFGPAFVAALRRITSLHLDVHLMIEHPDRYAKAFIDAGANTLTVHAEPESLHNVSDTLAAIRGLGCRCGLAINPPTPLGQALRFLPHIDLLLCMTVNPGFGGQAFMDEVLPKVTQARDWREANGASFDIEVDGGLAPSTVGCAVSAGANVIVAGTSIFGQPDARKAIEALRQKSIEARAGV